MGHGPSVNAFLGFRPFSWPGMSMDPADHGISNAMILGDQLQDLLC